MVAKSSEVKRSTRSGISTLNASTPIFAFDLRMAPGPNEVLTDEYRKNVLLNERTEFPLSADETIWPQVPVSEFESMITAATRELGWGHDPLSYCDSNNLLPNIPTDWLNGPFPGLQNGRWLIALAVDLDAARYLKSRIAVELSFPLSSITTDVLANNHWCCQGYDVADQMLYSGLLNTTFSDHERSAYKQAFAADINVNGLLVERTRAERFAEICDRRVKDHSPFFPVAVWTHPLIDDVRSSGSAANAR